MKNVHCPTPIFVSLIAGCLTLWGNDACGQGSQFVPAFDSNNASNWILNTDISDEFEDSELDQDKWLIQGMNGEYKSNWIGRAPSQFSTDNVGLEDGMLKLQARWEPDYEFSDKLDKSWKEAPGGGLKYENITTAAVISKKSFLHGYMEIHCKAADASVTSAFWMTGKGAELDVFEFSGRPKQRHKVHLESELWSSIHDWSKPGGPSTWTDRLQLPWKVAEGFHTYGVEWTEGHLKFHADGKLVRTVTRKEVEQKSGPDGWAIKTPLYVWVDSETFPWHGIPEKSDLPVDYEIEYIRIWQTQEDIAKQQATAEAVAEGGGLMGFEGPEEIDGKRQNWWIPPDSNKNFSIVGENAASGNKSLKFHSPGRISSKVVAFAPNGCYELKPGQHELTLKVWLEPGSRINSLRVVLEDPWYELKPFDLTGIESGKWVTLSQKFQRAGASGPKDRPRIFLEPEDVSGQRSVMYLDDLAIK